FRPSARSAVFQPCSPQRGCTSTCSCPRARSPPLAGRSRSLVTASATTRTTARTWSPPLWRATASRPSPSTSSATAAARTGGSLGGIYGTKLLAVEPDIHAGVPNVAGGAIIEVARLGVFRGLVALSLLLRTPSLSNTGLTFYPILGTSIPGFDENIPLRDQAVRIDTVPGAAAIQQVLDNTEWVSQSGNPVAYAPCIRKSPLNGVSAKSVILQFAKGDQTVPNPTTTAILRA